jgi:hypothetical protein
MAHLMFETIQTLGVRGDLDRLHHFSVEIVSEVDVVIVV